MFLLKVFESRYGIFRAVVLSSALFVLWHLKNIFWLEPDQLCRQMLYTGLFFAPVTSLMTYKLKTVWPAVIIHYLNNFSSPLKGWMLILM